MNFFARQKSPFEKYYNEITSQKVVAQCDHFKPFTAAYLFVLSDFALMARGRHPDRKQFAQLIFSYITKKMSNDELTTFDQAVDLFGSILRKERQARGDWCFYDGTDNSPIYNLYLCYGDLINAPYYLNDYNRSPIMIKAIDTQLQFASEFNRIHEITALYLRAVERW